MEKIMKNSIESVKEYYGKVLQSNQDLKTSACCTLESDPAMRGLLSQIHPEVLEKFYGCGSPIPPAIKNKTVLDLGSGSGRDCFVLSNLVGPEGRVIGVDMTESQIAVARKHLDYHAKQFGYAQSNVEFYLGYIEDLADLGIVDNSIDVVVSNCVINLSPDKERVFSEIFRVLKPGGELLFSDVFSGRRIPKALMSDPVLLGECLSGALYIEDFRRLLMKLGCHDYRVLVRSEISISDPEVHAKIGMVDFYSMTIRAFKVEVEDRCEDYGQVAYYKGGIEGNPFAFVLDDHHIFEKDRPVPVCSNTASMLKGSRLADYFRVEGNTETHFGLFDCSMPTADTKASKNSGACC